MRISDWSSDVCSSDLVDRKTMLRYHPRLEAVGCAHPGHFVTARSQRLRDRERGVDVATGTARHDHELHGCTTWLVRTAGARACRAPDWPSSAEVTPNAAARSLGRASCRERACQYV